MNILAPPTLTAVIFFAIVIFCTAANFILNYEREPKQKDTITKQHKKFFNL